MINCFSRERFLLSRNGARRGFAFTIVSQDPAGSVSGKGRRSEGGATCSTCPRQVRIKRRSRNSLKFSWTDTVGHACALCGRLVNYIELERWCQNSAVYRSWDLRWVDGKNRRIPRRLLHVKLAVFTKDSRNGETYTLWRSGGTERKRCRSDAGKIPHIILAFCANTCSARIFF